MIEANIDYLQYSADYLESNYKNKDWQLLEGNRFYTHCYKSEWGERVYFGNVNRKATGCLVVLSGEPLYNLGVMGFDTVDYLRKELKRGAKVSRLDIAFTEFVEDELIRVDDFEEWFKQKKITSNHANYGAKKIEEIKEENTVETLYIGDIKKRGKRGIFRAYDKGIEWGLGEYMITRLELEERGENAHNSAKRIADGKSLADVFRTRFSVDAKEFDRVVNGKALSLTRGKAIMKVEEKEKRDKRWDWLIEQVAPSLYDAVQDDAKEENSLDRAYWFLRRIGIGHEEAVTAVRSIQIANIVK